MKTSSSEISWNGKKQKVSGEPGSWDTLSGREKCERREGCGRCENGIDHRGEELKGTGISVTALCPGPTKSGFQSRARLEKAGLFSRKSNMDSAAVARIGYEGMMGSKRVVIPGWSNRLLVASARLMPRALIPGIVKKVQREEQ